MREEGSKTSCYLLLDVQKPYVYYVVARCPFHVCVPLVNLSGASLLGQIQDLRMNLVLSHSAAALSAATTAEHHMIGVVVEARNTSDAVGSSRAPSNASVGWDNDEMGTSKKRKAASGN